MSGLVKKTDSQVSVISNALHQALLVLFPSVLLLNLLTPLAVHGQVWKRQGPSPSQAGSSEVIGSMVAGAIHDVAPHPTNPDIVFVGATNGGIWRTENATADEPKWTFLDTGIANHSIGALEFDPTDDQNLTLVAGTGRYSSYYLLGGELSGLMITKDGGKTWTQSNGRGELRGLNISGVAPRGSTIVVSVDKTEQVEGRPNNQTLSDGIWRSTDGGNRFVYLNGEIYPEARGSGLPAGSSTAYDLVGDPTNPAILYTNAGSQGIFRSDDTGASWRKVSNAEMDAAMANNLLNLEIAVGNHNNIYVAIVSRVTAGGSTKIGLTSLFRSGNGGGNWVKLDLPGTKIGNRFNGIHVGGSGYIHLSIAADPNNQNLVYLGGDRQPSKREETGNQSGGYFPNSLGARGYTGRLFRVDASKPSGQQSTPITHSGTASNTAPHADSRDLAFNANGILFEADDGGVYRLEKPDGSDGHWSSAIGNLSPTEFHSVSWDAVNNRVIGGSQDNGTTSQRKEGAKTWFTILGGDGGVVAVDDLTGNDLSVRYYSYQYFGNALRGIYKNNDLQITANLPLLIMPEKRKLRTGASNTEVQFYTPLELHNTVSGRLIIGGRYGVYESLNQGDTLGLIAGSKLGGSKYVRVRSYNGGTPIAYGATNNADMLYVIAAPFKVTNPQNMGSDTREAYTVYVRSGPAPHNPEQKPAGRLQAVAHNFDGEPRGVVVNPNNAAEAYVITKKNVWKTDNEGGSFQRVTGNLQTLKPKSFQSLAYVNHKKDDGTNADAIVVGTSRGVFSASADNLNNWKQLGSGLPGARVIDLEYDAADHILLASLFGHGAWTLNLFGEEEEEQPKIAKCPTQKPDDPPPHSSTSFTYYYPSDKGGGTYISCAYFAQQNHGAYKKLKHFSEYVDNKAHGTVIEFRKKQDAPYDRYLYRIAEYESGNLHGVSCKYIENGKLESVSYSQDNKKHGKSFTYCDYPNPSCRIYDNGKLGPSCNLPSGSGCPDECVPLKAKVDMDDLTNASDARSADYEPGQGGQVRDGGNDGQSSWSTSPLYPTERPSNGNGEDDVNAIIKGF